MYDDVNSIKLSDYSYNNCVQDQKKTFESGARLFKNTWEDGLTATLKQCTDNNTIQKLLQKCKESGIDTENLITYNDDGTKSSEPHNGGSCFLGDIETVDEYCNKTHATYKGMNGYDDVPAPTIKDDGTIDYSGVEGVPACTSLDGIARVWNDIINTRGIGELNLVGTGKLSQDLRGLHVLKKECEERDIPWSECTEGAVNQHEDAKLRAVLDNTLQAQLEANKLAQEQTNAFDRGSAVALQQVQTAQQANQLAADITGVSLSGADDDTKDEEEIEPSVIFGVAGLTMMCCCFCILIIVIAIK